MGDERDFGTLIAYLQRVPGIAGPISSGRLDDGNWWVKFRIAPARLERRSGVGVRAQLPLHQRTTADGLHAGVRGPYLNGGPRDYLSWVIESKDPKFKPGTCMKWLDERLPRPVEDTSAWPKDE